MRLQYNKSLILCRKFFYIILVHNPQLGQDRMLRTPTATKSLNDTVKPIIALDNSHTNISDFFIQLTTRVKYITSVHAGYQ